MPRSVSPLPLTQPDNKIITFLLRKYLRPSYPVRVCVIASHIIVEDFAQNVFLLFLSALAVFCFGSALIPYLLSGNNDQQNSELKIMDDKD